MTNVAFKQLLSSLVKKSNRAFVFVCLYSVIMSVVALYMLVHLHGPASIQSSEINLKSRRQWYDVNGTMSARNASVEEPYEADAESVNVELEESERDKEGEDAITEVTPTIDPKIVPGYFLLDSDKPFTKRCGRCAVVSSSGHLYLSGAGVDIDRADCVLRMNTAPVSGWTEDVGSRTDVRIIGHVNLPRGLFKDNSLRDEILNNVDTRTKYVVVPWLYEEEIDMKDNRIIKAARELKETYPDVEFVFQTKAKYNETEQRFLLELGYTRATVHTWFSTGYVSMLTALDMCDEVQVYGLANEDFCKQHPESTVPYHYYEPSKITECRYQQRSELKLNTGHKFLTERAMFARWSLINKINFHYPSWKATIANVTAHIDTPFLRKYEAAVSNMKSETSIKDDPPHYIFKNGKKYRVIRKHVKVKPKPKPDLPVVADKPSAQNKTSSTNPKRRIVRKVVKKKTPNH